MFIKKYIILFIVAFLITGCSPKLWNKPFIDVQEMAALEPGMSKKEILDLMPEPPLYIHSGDHQTSVWVYEWRLLEVKSEMKLEGFKRLVIPKKTDDEQQHQRITTEIFLTFDINDKLLAWGAAPYEYPIPAIPDNSTNDKPFTLELKVEGNQDGILTIEGAGNEE